MKTFNIRLLASIITLAAVLATNNTSEAQRRTENNTDNKERIREDHKNKVGEKNSARNNAYEKEAEIRKVNNRKEVNRNQKSLNDNSVKSAEKQKVFSSYTRREQSKNAGQNPDFDSRKTSYQTDSRELIRKNRNYISAKSERNNPAPGRIEKSDRRNSDYRNNDFAKNENSKGDRPNRNSGISNREKYNLNNDETRYKPNVNYRGSDKYWSDEIRRNHHEYGNQGRRDYNHDWNSDWEHYKWNMNSWRNYYSYYDPYSYRNSRYYFYHPVYGHVISRFAAPPMVFIHNHHKYYCSEGHFFRYRPGIGYILVDIPFGMTFSIIPDNYEMVYINGYLYFRLGNLFLDYTQNGYQLMHYPERYYACDDHYYNGGFNFSLSIN